MRMLLNGQLGAIEFVIHLRKGLAIIVVIE